MKKTIAVVLILIATVIGGYLLLKKDKDTVKYRTEKVTRGDIISSVTATGTVNPVTTVLVGTQVSGTIKHIYVDFNSPVKKGQIVAQIDPATFEAQVEQSRANLLAAQSNIQKAEATLIDAKRTLERNRLLFSKGLIARSDLDSAETNYETAKAQAETAKAQAEQAKASLKMAETNLMYTRIVSPVDGIVISRNVDVGQTVAASFQTPTLFTIAQDLTKMEIHCNVSEADIGRVKTGQTAEFTVDAYPDTIFKGKVYQIRNAPITVQNVVTYDVVVKVENPDLKLKPGMTANISIIVETKRDILKIPNAALRFRPPEMEKDKRPLKRKGVWMIDNGKLTRREITLGISDGSYTEVRSGLNEGDSVIVEALTKEREKPVTGPRFF
mgnify:FL=1